MSTTETMALCWICQEPADSAEHRIKKADLVRAYGSGPYSGSSELVHVRDGVMTPIQGPGSTRLKYEPSLCHNCNTTISQPFDRAYDRFVSWLFANEAAVLRKRIIDFRDVFGTEFEQPQANLFKYFVKSFGCRLRDAEQPIPRDLIELLPLNTFWTALKITFCVNEDILLLPEDHREGCIGKGDLGAYISKTDSSIIDGYIWDEHISWFVVRYWYGVLPESGFGSTWIANARHIYLGSATPLSAEQRADLLAKVR